AQAQHPGTPPEAPAALEGYSSQSTSLGLARPVLRTPPAPSPRGVAGQGCRARGREPLEMRAPGRGQRGGYATGGKLKTSAASPPREKGGSAPVGAHAAGKRQGSEDPRTRPPRTGPRGEL